MYECRRYIFAIQFSRRLRSVSHLFLVGGFAESPLVQEEVRSMFTTNTLKVLIPQVLYLLLIVIKPTTYMCNRTSLQTVTYTNQQNIQYVVLSELPLCCSNE